ncbi:AbfB domain-containing protein, partial [Streptomyces sp. MCAF7]
PDRYIRHYAYQLRLDPITTATGRSDATFRVTS